jgi:hypothetical protein
MVGSLAAFDEITISFEGYIKLVMLIGLKHFMINSWD